MHISLDLGTLETAYAGGSLSPLDVVDDILGRFARTPYEGIFIGEPCANEARARARALVERRARGEALPLYGIPFAVKDNIDVAGMPTTAACPAFAYRATANAVAVERLLQAGAVLIGKTNLDQFATGLVGVRSPYGIPQNPFDERYIAGGSSSGSAVAVARGLCSFALGTDTAGSGRVPAAFNNIVGLKPTRGMISTRGVVPACRSLDCVSVFALTVDDAAKVAQLLAGYDPEDAYARAPLGAWDPRPGLSPASLRVAVPLAAQRVFDDHESPAMFARALQALEGLGGQSQAIDFTPFERAGALLYGGAFVAERLEAAGDLLARDPDALHPAVRSIMASAAPYHAKDAFLALNQLSALRNQVDALWNTLDFLIVPSAPSIFRIDQVLADPLVLNQRLGCYANFVNLLDLCALAVPAGLRSDGLPFGVTLIARRGRDALLASVGRTLHAALASSLGATPHAPSPPSVLRAKPGERAALAVVGAHLSGEPLNRELTDLGARLIATTRTAPRYRLFSLPTTPKKPGLVRVSEDENGFGLELEVWELDNAALGTFMRGVKSPLCIGTVELADGANVLGFLCESAAVGGQRDISSFGGWRAFRRTLS